ncbi:MAG: hypothetical protein AAB768_02685 [Patescibacteria group bacterium]
MSELTEGETTIPRDSKDAVLTQPAVPLSPASKELSKVGISAMQGVESVPQLEPELITQADLDAPIKESEVWTDPTVENPDETFADPSSPPSESPIESPVRRQG